MKLTININDKISQDFNGDKFKEFFGRLKDDVRDPGTICGQNEMEIIEELEKAFKNAEIAVTEKKQNHKNLVPKPLIYTEDIPKKKSLIDILERNNFYLQPLDKDNNYIQDNTNYKNPQGSFYVFSIYFDLAFRLDDVNGLEDFINKLHKEWQQIDWNEELREQLLNHGGSITEWKEAVNWIDWMQESAHNLNHDVEAWFTHLPDKDRNPSAKDRALAASKSVTGKKENHIKAER